MCHLDPVTEWSSMHTVLHVCLSTIKLSCSFSLDTDSTEGRILYRRAFVRRDAPASSRRSAEIHVHAGPFNDLSLSMASLMPALHLNSICTRICIQFVCCEIIRSAASSYQLVRSVRHVSGRGHAFCSHQIWKLNGRDVTSGKQENP